MDDPALESALAAEARNPLDPIPKQDLSRLFLAQGREREAMLTAERSLAASAALPMLARAIAAFGAGDLRSAQAAAQARLDVEPDDAGAMLLLAELAAGAGIVAEAERHLRCARTVLPAHVETLQRLAETLATRGVQREAIACLDEALALDPTYSVAALMRLYLLAQLGDYEPALAGYDQLLQAQPDNVGAWVGRGHLLKTLGDVDASAASFRRAVALAPESGEAWWGMADIAAGTVTMQDAATIKAALTQRRPSILSAAQLHFALGKAHEDARDYSQSFQHYDNGNRLARQARPYDPRAIGRQVDDMIALLTPRFVAARPGWGHRGRSAIFILGMPRAGSTLVEQILASHSQVEGTAELPYVPLLAYEIVADRWRESGVETTRAIADLDDHAFDQLGRRYLALAGAHRRRDVPFFIDKLPDNWPLVPFIHLILPDAIIIDARRDPRACGFGNFKQYFAQGRDFSFKQADIGAYIRDYVRLMAHVDAVLPGRVVRVEHEALLADPERVVRDLLDRIGLTFEPACLAFHENRRPVRTASAAQVRRPLNAAGTALWQHYRPWLRELEDALESAG